MEPRLSLIPSGGFEVYTEVHRPLLVSYKVYLGVYFLGGSSKWGRLTVVDLCQVRKVYILAY